MIDLSITPLSPRTHRFKVEISVNKIAEAPLKIRLPKWRPGRYELTNNEANIYDFAVMDPNSRSIDYRKTSPSEYLIHASNSDQIIISYDYLANQADAGGSFLDTHELYINFINCIFSMEGHEHLPIKINFKLPEDWTHSTALESLDKNTFAAADLEELYDSPIVFSTTIETVSIDLDDCKFFVDIIGNHRLDITRLTNDFKKFISYQISCFEKMYCEDYRFMIKINPYRCYHGVEHFKSTMITLGPSEKSNEPEFYEHLLGISSHELFHHWNAKLLRPRELQPYKYFAPVLFDTGYVIEGFTTFLGDYILYKSGVYDETWFLKEINKSIKRHCHNFGRRHQSLIDSSNDLWVDGYKNIAPNRKVSIYTEGSIFAFILHLTLEHHGKKSLTDLIKSLILKHDQDGYDHGDVITACKELVPAEIVEQLFNNYLTNKDKLIDGLEHALGTSEYALISKSAEHDHERLYGFSLQSQENIQRISNIDPLSPAFSMLRVSDKVISMDLSKDSAKLTLANKYGEETVTISASNNTYFGYFEIIKKPT